MLKIAVVVDDWKLPIFRDVFDEGGFSYTETPWRGNNKLTTLKVDTETVNKLKPFVEKAESKASRSKMH